MVSEGAVDRGTSPMRHISPLRRREETPLWVPPVLPGLPFGVAQRPAHPVHPPWETTLEPPLPPPAPVAAGSAFVHGHYGHTGVAGLAAGLVGEAHSGVPRGLPPPDGPVPLPREAVLPPRSEEERAMQAAREQFKANARLRAMEVLGQAPPTSDAMSPPPAAAANPAQVAGIVSQAQQDQAAAVNKAIAEVHAAVQAQLELARREERERLAKDQSREQGLG